MLEDIHTAHCKTVTQLVPETVKQLGKSWRGAKNKTWTRTMHKLFILFNTDPFQGHGKLEPFQPQSREEGYM